MSIRTAAAFLSMLILVVGYIPGCIGPGGDLDDEGVPASEVEFMIVVHHEPGKKPNTTEDPKLHWLALVALVKSADDHQQKLTLLFNPQWATYILEDQARLTLVRGWEANGHEIGLHFHGAHMGEWNGYTDQAAYRTSIKYVGTVAGMMDIVKRVPASGKINTICMNDEDAVFDLPAGIPYDVDGGANRTADLVSRPTAVTWNGHAMTQLKHARYSGKPTDSVSVTQDDIDKAIKDYEKGTVLGIVFHTFEYDEDNVPFDQLFAHLEDKGIRARSTSSIMAL